MYGQMTAGSWIYIGTQGILQGTYETLAALAAGISAARSTGRLVVTAGLGGMGGAQPLAVTMNGGVALVVEVDPDAHRAAAATRLPRRVWRRSRRRAGARAEAHGCGHGALDRARGQRCGRAARTGRRGIMPDVVTDQTSAHDPLVGYVPNGLTLAERCALRNATGEYVLAPSPRWRAHVSAMLALQQRGAVTFDYGNNIRAQALESRRRRCVRDPRLRSRIHPAALLRRQGAVPLGGAVGRPGRHRRDRSTRARNVRRRRRAVPLDPPGPRARGVPGLAGTHLLAGLRRPRAVRAGLNDLVRRGDRHGADRDRPRSPRHRFGGVAQPRNRRDARRQRRDRRLADPERAGQRVVPAPPGCRCTTAAASASAIASRRHGNRGRRLARGGREAPARADVRSGIGVVRHADAGYPEAIEAARARAWTCRCPREGRGDDHPGAAVARAPRPDRARRSRRAARIPVVLGGCGTGRTSLLLRLRDLIGRRRASTSTSSASRPRRSDASVDPRALAAAAAARRGRPRRGRRARGVRRDAGVARPAAPPAARRRRSCSTSSSSCARSRASPACAPCCATSSARSPRAAIVSC